MLLKSRVTIRTNYKAASGSEDTPSIIHKLFGNNSGKKEKAMEHETFPAVPLLQQIGMVLKSLKIDNIISFTHDGTEFYNDEEEKPGDLPEIIKKFNEEINRLFGEYLGAIKFSVETEQDGIRYSIMTSINKVHPPGAFPIVMDITGLVDGKNAGGKERYYFFIEQLELAMSKYLQIADIRVNHGDDTENGESRIPEPGPDSTENETADDIVTAGPGEKGIRSDALFPLYGVTLGKTSEKELGQLGKHSTMRDNEGKLYKYYVVKGMNFWYDNGTATHMYITYTDPLPDQWRRMGFSWKLSYNSWMKLFKNLKWETQLIKEPGKVKHFTGKGDSFEAEVSVSAPSKGTEYVLRLDFSYSNKTGVSDTDTLYSISINTP